jgi:hypothetical protein
MFAKGPASAGLFVFVVVSFVVARHSREGGFQRLSAFALASDLQCRSSGASSALQDQNKVTG